MTHLNDTELEKVNTETIVNHYKSVYVTAECKVVALLM